MDAGSLEEPAARYFGSLEAAVEAMNAYPERFRRFSWIGEMVPSSRVPVVHVKDGKRTGHANDK